MQIIQTLRSFVHGRNASSQEAPIAHSFASIAALFDEVKKRMEAQALNKPDSMWRDHALLFTSAIPYLISVGYVPAVLKQDGTAPHTITHKQIKEFLGAGTVDAGQSSRNASENGFLDAVLKSAQHIIDILPRMSEDEQITARDALEQILHVAPGLSDFGSGRPSLLRVLAEISGEELTPDTDFIAVISAANKEFESANSLETSEKCDRLNKQYGASGLLSSLKISAYCGMIILESLPEADDDTQYSIEYLPCAYDS